MMLLPAQYPQKASIKFGMKGVPTVTQQVKNPTSIHEDEGSILASFSWLRILRCHKLQHSSQVQLGSGIAVAVA